MGHGTQVEKKIYLFIYLPHFIYVISENYIQAF